MSTLREHLEAQIGLYNQTEIPAHERAYQMAEHAVAALAILDASEREQRITDWEEVEWEHTDNRLVPDPSVSS